MGEVEKVEVGSTRFRMSRALCHVWTEIDEARLVRIERELKPRKTLAQLRFIAHHLWDEEEREKNLEHGMPQEVDKSLRAKGRLKSTGPPALATVRGHLALWSSLHRWRRLEEPFGNPSVRNALRLATRAADRPRARKSASAITRDILDRLLATCGRGRAVDLRDRALLLLAFGSGGRRRSEIVRLKVDDLEEREPVPADPTASSGESFPFCRSGCGARKPRPPTPARACSSSADPSKLYWLGSLSPKSEPVWCFGGSTNGGTSAVPRLIRKASTPGSRAAAPSPDSIRRNFRRMGCDLAIWSKPRAPLPEAMQ